MFKKVLKTPVDKRPFLTTALPASPNDRDQIILTDSLTAGTYQWLLQYVAARSTNKWVFIGGAGGTHTILTAQSFTASATWVDVATIGPTFTVPVAGDYDVFYGCDAYLNSGTGQVFTGPAIGATTPLSNFGYVAGTNQENLGFQRYRMAGLSASNEIRLRYYQSSAATVSVAARNMLVLPVALGG